MQPGTFLEVRNTSGTVLCRSTLAEFGSSDTNVPTLPKHVTGFVSNSADFGESTAYFNAGGDGDAGQYRVRASILDRGPYKGGQLLVAVPLQRYIAAR